MHLRFIWLFICPFLLSVPVFAASLPVEPQVLSSQLRIDRHDVAISNEDWHWLRRKNELVIGVSATETEPFRVVDDDNQYEGISADASALIAQLLGVQVRVVPFSDDQAALRALQAGSVDLVSQHIRQAPGQALIFTRPFARDRLALFKHANQPQASPDNLAGLTVAVASQHSEEARQRFPQALIRVYPGHDQAIAAAAFGQADLYLDDVLSAYYRLNHSFYGYLRFERFADLPTAGYGFALRADNSRLQALVDIAIEAIGKEQLTHLARRWLGNSFIPNEGGIALTTEEARWLARHPRVRLQINDDLAPVAFFDANGAFSGIAADLLEVISLNTGLRFDVQSRSGSYPQRIESLRNKRADLAIMTASPERGALLRFSRPFLSSRFVLLGKQGEAVEPGDLAGKRLAIPTGLVGLPALRERYPNAQLVEAGASLDAMNLLYEGKADAAVAPLATARYYNIRLFDNGLSINALLDIGPATANFAMRRSDSELQSILDKALQDISPDELTAITNRWRSPPGMSGETWRDYRTLITELVAGAVVLLALALVWVLYLRRQIRARTRAEHRLNDQLQFIETLTDSMPRPLYVRDVDGRMLSCNRSYLASVGLSADQVLNKTIHEMPGIEAQALPDFHGSYLRAMREGQSIEAVHAIRMHGKEAWIEHWIQPFEDSQGVTRGVICGWMDLTEHHRLVQQLQEAKEQAIEASRAKTRFLATMSHEIRTPMNAVIGLLELILKRSADERIDRVSIEIAHNSATGLLELIGDILDIARIESGRMTLSPKRANLRELVESVARVFEGLARQKRLTLMLEIDAEINRDVLVDALRFKQVVSNLLSNAIKFTEVGFVKVTVVGHLNDSAQMDVQVIVEDSGIGIAAHDQQQLFQPFVQVQRNVRENEGTGLGLVICRSLCEMMGGQVSISSEPGQGTRVDMALRFQVLEAVAGLQAGQKAPSGQRYRLQVLVVDDHQVNRRVLHQQLSFLGHDVSEAENGQVAFERWSEGAFDVVITDCHMPVMSGSQLAQAIRQAEGGDAQERTVIIGLTADAQPEEIELCIKAGMDDCLIKPIGVDELDARLRTLHDDGPPTEVQPHLAASDLPMAAATAVMDLAPLKLLLNNEPVKFRQILEELVNNNQHDRQQLATLLAQRDTERLARLSHRIKGAAQVVRAVQLVSACRQLDAVCGAPQLDVERLEVCVAELDQALGGLELALEQSGVFPGR
ncbi:multi-sensor hybrid histidine kinase [Pseudomonas sp. UC 17F4]|uniref:transporter substrate-binding domain-containing protein n=1 Tax=Pseudomonas sp. UC 17F4 TaxID=1855328 RepID=UPI0008807CBE|nr:transporter substrate-binding domain-containing protein [Pseudomonas sp. UC 17F4]SDQ71184.1 multi-sensor hybrid histidine kinase [Pseudomonas sp. UC 17F4]